MASLFPKPHFTNNLVLTLFLASVHFWQLPPPLARLSPNLLLSSTTTFYAGLILSSMSPSFRVESLVMLPAPTSRSQNLRTLRLCPPPPLPRSSGLPGLTRRILSPYERSESLRMALGNYTRSRSAPQFGKRAARLRCPCSPCAIGNRITKKLLNSVP